MLSIISLTHAYPRSGSASKSLQYFNSKKIAHTSVDLNGNNMVFKGLPKHNSDAYLLDNKGNVEKACKVNSANNTINLAILPKGSHFIALKKGATVKLFGYSTEITVTAKRS